MQTLPNLCQLNVKTTDLQQSYTLILHVISPTPTIRQLEESACHANTLNWDLIFTLATNNMIAPLFYKRLCERKLASQVPPNTLEALQSIYELNKQRNKQLKQILLDALSILNAGGITPTLLKGANNLMGRLPYSECRMMGDIDLLIPAHAISDARELLISAGYYHEIDDLEKALNPQSHHLYPLFHPSGYSYIELHRKANFSQFQKALNTHLFSQEQLLQQSGNGVKFLQQPLDNLLLYNQIHNHYSFINRILTTDLRYLTEQGLLIQQLSPESLQPISQTIKQYAKNFLPSFHLQNALLHSLMEIPVDQAHRTLDKTTRKHYQQALLLMLQDKKALQARKRKIPLSIVKHLVYQTLTARWEKDQILNWQWIKTRPARLLEALQGDRLLR